MPYPIIYILKFLHIHRELSFIHLKAYVFRKKRRNGKILISLGGVHFGIFAKHFYHLWGHSIPS